LNFQAIDTTGLSAVQLFPDVTARIEREGIFGAVQLSLVMTMLSLKDESNRVKNRVGVGGSLSGTIDFKDDHQLLYQVTYGKSISHFITTFSSTGNDAYYNVDTNTTEPVFAFGGFLSYGIQWRKNLVTNISAGYADLSNEAFQADNSYRNSMSILLDSFWNIVDGARIGGEYAYGQRWDKNGTTGGASRISNLFYYNF
jgi:hypothetical protein